MNDTASPHLDLDALADALAGEGDPGATAHLATCPSCTSRLRELEVAEQRVVAVLATLPPPAVPDDLAARLASAFSAEPALTAGRSTVTALPERAPRRRTWLPAVAAGVLLFSGAGLGYALLTGSSGGEDTTDSTAAGAAGPDLVLNASGTDYADAAAVTGALPDVLEGRANPVALDGTGGYSAEAQTGDEAAASTGATGGGETGRSGADTSLSAQAPVPATADPLARLRTATGLSDCLAALLPPDEPDLEPLALDYATYSGQPALAVVLPDPDPDKLSVFVVGPGCSRADDSTLHFFRADAP